MKTPLLETYKNGNYRIDLYSDGTKVRETDEDVFLPSFPESMDMKITDKCDMNCPFCHEESHAAGAHADLDKVILALRLLPRGIELALGGGNPLDHPLIGVMLKKLKRMGFICNMTVNMKHLAMPKYKRMIETYLDMKFIHGLGVSWVKGVVPFKHATKNIVAHAIAGIHSATEVLQMLRLYGKVLILGYKNYGRGSNHLIQNPDIKQKIEDLRNKLRKLFVFGTVSFDNLSIDQLNVRRHLSEEKWDEFYMGDEGQFTMYFDAVKMQYAVSSTSKREDVRNRTVRTYFTEMIGRSK